jgi:DNA-binding CsgD family transcriptional regulator
VNFDRAAATAERALGPARFRELREAGQRLRWDEAIALAGLVETPPLAGSEPPQAGENDAATARPTGPRTNSTTLAEMMRSAPDASPAPGLTNREQDVLALLCQRQTDGEIALHLSISRKTASSHVSNILAKLGAANRREAAAIAVRSGLR